MRTKTIFTNKIVRLPRPHSAASKIKQGVGDTAPYEYLLFQIPSKEKAGRQGRKPLKKKNPSLREGQG